MPCEVEAEHQGMWLVDEDGDGDGQSQEQGVSQVAHLLKKTGSCLGSGITHSRYICHSQTANCSRCCSWAAIGSVPSFINGYSHPQSKSIPVNRQSKSITNCWVVRLWGRAWAFSTDRNFRKKLLGEKKVDRISGTENKKLTLFDF